MAAEEIVSPITRPEDVERSPQGVVRRWVAELNLAERDERDWRKEAETLWELYEGEKKKANSFNIFWSNTETLLPAVYNSTPEPDVRRRFRDADPVGKAVSEVIERALVEQVDEYDFDAVGEALTLDMLVTGRGVTRIKYEPRLVPMPGQPPVEQEAEPEERLDGESVVTEHVQWNDFRRGPGKRWDEVPWVAFRHDFTADMAEDQFGPELAQKLKYSEGKNSGEITKDAQTRELFKTVEVWEIWDRDERRVLFIAPTYAEAPCFETADPLKLSGFFPMPRPAYAVRQTRSLVPIPLYRLYEEQARELNRVSARINKIVEALKIRGGYASSLKEVSNILEAGDNEMVPIKNVSELANVGGLEKAIWIMPLEKLRQVLDGLYLAREQIKQSIYEITGLSDIIRGSTVASETASAQQLKSQWGSLRLQRMQREVQRVMRDLMRLKAEVIAEQFQPQTLSQITNLQYPTEVQKQQATAIAQQAQAAQQPVPPEVEAALKAPSWESILQVMRSDGLRQYRVDIETDSTVADTINRDMQGLSEVMQAVGQVLSAVPMGLPPEVAKEVALSVVRRARLGSAVEDALENFEMPQQPQGDPTAAIEGVKSQIMDIIKTHGAKEVQAEMAAREQQNQTKVVGQAVQQIGAMGEQAVMGVQELAARQDQQAEMVAQIGQALSQIQQAGMGANEATQAALGQVAQAFQSVLGGLEQVVTQLQGLAEQVSKPKRVMIHRDADGKVAGAETVQ